MLKIKSSDKKKYVLAEKRDYKILESIYNLEKYELSQEDKNILKLIKTQLEKDWRKPLMNFLYKLNKKYNKNK